MSDDNSNTFTNIMYVLIWVSAFGLINNIISLFTKNQKNEAIVYAIILILSIVIYTNISKQKIVLREINTKLQ
jgi:TRAP-type uncharacterized transport system fused permease subunit